MLTDKKIMITALSDNPSVIITKLDDKKAEFEVVGNIKKEILFDMEVYRGNETIGIIRKKDEKDNTQIELWEENSVAVGDVINIKTTTNRKGDLLYGFNVFPEISQKISHIFLSIAPEDVNGLYFTLSESENEIKSMVTSVSPDVIIFIYPVKATENCEISKGCGIVYKDGGAVTELKVRDFVVNIAKENNIETQTYIGSQMPLTETFGILGKGATVISICVPVSHLGTRTEIADLNDIKAAVELAVKIATAEIGE